MKREKEKLPEKRRYCCKNVEGGQGRGDCLGGHLHQVGGDQGGGGQVVILVENRMGRPGTPGPRSVQITEYYPSHVCGKLLQLLNFKQKTVGEVFRSSDHAGLQSHLQNTSC